MTRTSTGSSTSTKTPMSRMRGIADCPSGTRGTPATVPLVSMLDTHSSRRLGRTTTSSNRRGRHRSTHLIVEHELPSMLTVEMGTMLLSPSLMRKATTVMCRCMTSADSLLATRDHPL